MPRLLRYAALCCVVLTAATWQPTVLQRRTAGFIRLSAPLTCFALLQGLQLRQRRLCLQPAMHCTALCRTGSSWLTPYCAASRSLPSRRCGRCLKLSLGAHCEA